MLVLSLARFERFFRVAAGLAVDKTASGGTARQTEAP